MGFFCTDFEILYVKRFMTLNVQQLVHLGRLYTQNSFSLKDKNGIILKVIRGTQNIDNQIISCISFV